MISMEMKLRTEGNELAGVEAGRGALARAVIINHRSGQWFKSGCHGPSAVDLNNLNRREMRGP